jgi:hypothetical protein
MSSPTIPTRSASSSWPWRPACIRRPRTASWRDGSSGFVERADPGTYRLGIRLLELGNVVKSRISIGQAAMPLMQRLHRQLGESVNLGVRQGDEIVYVERTSSGRSSVRVVHLVGARAPLHVTAVGKLYLAEDGPQKLRDYVKRTGLPGYTPTSLTTLAALEREVDRVRRHGVAFDNEEIEQGLRCIAAPVRDDSGNWWPASRFRHRPSATAPTGPRWSRKPPTPFRPPSATLRPLWGANSTQMR